MEKRVIRVQGEGKVSVEPDLAVLTFSVQVKHPEYAGCSNALNANVARLRRDLAACGIESARVKTMNLNIAVDTAYEEGRTKFVGFQASHTLRVEIPADKDLLNRVFLAIAQGNSDAQVQIAFSVKDQAALLRQSLEQAVKTATENAQILARAANVKLGALLEMNYGETSVRVYEQREMLMAQSVAGGAAPVDIEPENVRAENTVTLVWEIA
jgi:uncharacterized protein YggE